MDDSVHVFKFMSEQAMILDPEYRILAANPAALNVTGLAEKDIVNRFCYEIFHNTDHPPEDCPCERLKQSHHNESGDMELEAVGGIFLVTVAPIFDESGKWIKTVHIARDITERKKVEKIIRKQNTFLNEVIESLPYSFYVIDVTDYSIVMANSKTAADKQWQGKTCYALTHHRTTPCNGKEHTCPLEKVLQTRKPAIVEHIHYDNNGNRRHVEVHGYPIFDGNGNIVQMLEYAIDITERKLREEERESLIAEFEEVVAKVKLLSGFLPICASCKKIRDDKGYWQQIESYIKNHSEAQFSHSICPECIKKYYPKLEGHDE
jgi:PAS domain S-box-containing protein